MQRVVAVSDDDNKMEIAFSDGSVRHDYATDLVHVWTRVSTSFDERGVATKTDLEVAYNKYRDALVERFGCKPEQLSRATATLVCDAACKIYNALKKTHIDFTNSNLLDSPQPDSKLGS